MAKERLSQLQKWILINCYKAQLKVMSPDQIIWRYFKKRTQTSEVTLSNSIRNLTDKGLIRSFSPIPLETMAFIYGMQRKSKEEFRTDYKDVLTSSKKEKVTMPSIRGLTKVKMIQLTDKGETRTKELLNIK